MDIEPSASSQTFWTGASAVADVMVRRPKTLPHSATVGQVRTSFVSDHVHMVLLVEPHEVVPHRDDRGLLLRGTLVRTDLPTEVADEAHALPHARLTGRTVSPDEDPNQVYGRMLTESVRRFAVVDHELRLHGLLCLKRHRGGFCADENVAARATERREAKP